MMTTNKIQSLIGESMRIFIFPHILPDGDTIGSAYALASYIRNLGKEVLIITEDIVPINLNQIPQELFYEFESDMNTLEKPDLIIAVDSSDTTRLGKRVSFIESGCKVVNIDHHITNEQYGDFNFVDEKASSTAEMIYELLHSWDHAFTVDEATALYMGISTDTGSFMYSNTTSKTMRTAGELMDIGIDINTINTELYQNQPLRKVRLMTLVLDSLVIDFEYNYARITVTQKMLKEADASYEDIDGLVEFIRNIQGVEVVALFKQMTTEKVKISLRSKHAFDVSAVALGFNGGGHTKAAGCVIESNLENAIRKIDFAIKSGA